MTAWMGECGVDSERREDYIAVGELCGFFVNLFLLFEGVVCGERRAEMGDGRVEGGKVVVESSEHGLERMSDGGRVCGWTDLSDGESDKGLGCIDAENGSAILDQE